MRLRSLVVFVPVAAGCSLGSLDGFSGGGVDAGARDDGGGPSTVEAGADAVADATPGGDASIDAQALGFCASRTLTTANVCEDFDGVATGWTVAPEGAGSTVGVSTSVARSGARSLAAAIASTGVVRAARWERGPVGTENVHHARLSYALYIDQVPSAGGYEVNMWRFKNGGDTSDIYAFVSSNGFSLYEQFSKPGVDADTRVLFDGISVPIKTWLGISVEVDYDAQQVQLKVNDDVRQAATTLIRLGAPYLGVGITFAGVDVTEGKVFVDDVFYEKL